MSLTAWGGLTRPGAVTTIPLHGHGVWIQSEVFLELEAQRTALVEEEVLQCGQHHGTWACGGANSAPEDLVGPGIG